MTVEPLHGSTTALVTHPRSAPELVSVVVPVLNEVSDLPAQLAALADQTYAGPWELIVCDNGSVDGTPELAASWTDRLPDVRVVDASDRKGINHARNVGVEHARGDFVAFCDGDDVVSPDWLDALVAAAPHADIVAGALDMEHLNGAGATRPQPLPAALPVKHRFLPGVPGGNCGVWRAVAVELGWDERFTFGSSDIEFGWRARLAGYRIDYAPRAVVRVRVPAGLQALARQWYRYGASDGRLFRTFRRFGMQRSRVGEAARAWAWILVHVGDLWGPDPTRLQWVRVASLRAGRLIGSVRARTLFL
jgi:glycosyltransferase involved in cell wall biosynthesis